MRHRNGRDDRAKNKPNGAKIALLGLLLTLLGMLAACSQGPSLADDQRELDRLLSVRKTAMEARDTKTLVGLLSPRYRDASGDFAQAQSLIETAIGGAQSIQVTLSARQIELAGDKATTRQTYFLVAVYDGLTQTLKGTEKLLWARENQHWKLVGGLTE